MNAKKTVQPTRARRAPTPQESIQTLLYESLFFIRDLDKPDHLGQAIDKASEAINLMTTLATKAPDASSATTEGRLHA